MRIAVLNTRNEVENVIVADRTFADKQGYAAFVPLSDDQWCDIGAKWDGKKFTPTPGQ